MVMIKFICKSLRRLFVLWEFLSVLCIDLFKWELVNVRIVNFSLFYMVKEWYVVFN